MRKPLIVRILSSLDTRAWIALAVFLGLALAVVPALHLALPEDSPFHVSTYAITLLGKIMCYALVAVAMDLIWGYGGILSLGHGLFFALGGYAFGMYLMRQASGAELPAFMVFLDWKALPWFWLGSDSFGWAAFLALALPAVASAAGAARRSRSSPSSAVRTASSRATCSGWPGGVACRCPEGWV